jgi:hypothetical protein
MPAVNVDCAFLESDDLWGICRELGIPEAGMFIIRLWSWGMSTNKDDGVVDLDPTRLAAICKWTGDVDLLWRTLTSPDHKVLRHEGGGRWYMMGWEERNGAYFRKKRANRERMRLTRTHKEKDAWLVRYAHATDALRTRD